MALGLCTSSHVGDYGKDSTVAQRQTLVGYGSLDLRFQFVLNLNASSLAPFSQSSQYIASMAVCLPTQSDLGSPALDRAEL